MSFTSDDFFGAINTLLDQKLQGLAFDQTVIGTVIDDSQRKNGSYVIYDGSVKFIAYGDSSYKKNDQVRINIPNGDFTSSKFIVGKYISDSSINPIVYKSTLDDILDLTDNLFTDTEKVNGITASYSEDFKLEKDKLEKKLGIIDLKNSKYLDVQENNIFDTLYISADFKTNFSQKMLTGNYGLKLILSIQSEEEEEGEKNKFTKRELLLDSSMFFGDPYVFPIYSKQIAKFDITNISNISDIQVCLYQKNNFKYYDNTPLKNENDIIINHILVKNIKIGFGLSIKNISDNTIKLYSPDSSFFNEVGGDKQKRIGLLWINKDEYDNYIGFSDGIYDVNYNEIDELLNEKAGQENRYSIYWYKYKHGYNPAKDTEKNPSAKYFSKINWQRLDLQRYPSSINVGLPKKYFKAEDGKIYFNKKSEDYLTIDLDIGAKEEQIMALIIYNHQAYFSEPIVFINALGENTLELMHKNQSFDNYLLYGKDNKLLNSGDAHKPRQIEINYENLKNLDKANIYWYIPKEKYTMIKGIDTNTFQKLNESSEDFLYDSKFYDCYYKTIENEQDYILTYYIKNYLSNLQNRNTIYCVIKNDSQALTDKIDFIFGNYSDKLNDYNIQLTPMNSSGAIVNKEPLEIKLTVTDREDNLVKIYTKHPGTWEKNKVYFSFKMEEENIKFQSDTPYSFQEIAEKNKDSENGVEEIYFQIFPEDIDNEQLGYCILQVSIWIDPQTKLYGYYPVPWSSGNYYIEGPGAIVYDNKMQNPEYYKKSFKIFNKENDKEIKDVSWELKVLDESGREVNRKLNPLVESFLPSLDEKTNCLLVCKQYLENNDFNVLVICYDNKKNILWKQPIFITLNQFGILNDPQAEKKNLILEKNGGIVSIESGKISLTEDQTYNGTFFGEIGATEEEEDEQARFGLYCYYNGEKRAQINSEKIYFKGINKINEKEYHFYIDTSNLEYPLRFVKIEDDKEIETLKFDWRGNFSLGNSLEVDDSGNITIKNLTVTENLNAKIKVSNGTNGEGGSVSITGNVNTVNGTVNNADTVDYADTVKDADTVNDAGTVGYATTVNQAGTVNGTTE